MDSTPATKAVNEQQTDFPPYRWVVLALTSACFLLTFIVRFTWPPLIPVVVPVLNMKMSQAGAFMGAFYLGYVITQIPAGVLADYFGIRFILACSLIVEGLSTFGMGYIGSYESGFALRVVTGLGAGAVFAACARALMEWFAPKQRGTAFGLLLGAPSAGIFIVRINRSRHQQVVWMGGCFSGNRRGYGRRRHYRVFSGKDDVSGQKRR